MATSPATFDVGPLSWVKSEIEHSLGEVRTHLDRLVADPANDKAAKYIATHLHQVTGALSMVGLGAATRFNEAIEKLAESFLDTGAHDRLVNNVAVTKRAMASLSAYLDNLMAGEPDRPMMLASAYQAVNVARGASDIAESDLFSPDLSTPIPMPDDTIALPKSDMMTEAIKHRRGMYQTGLLKLLRDKDLAGGARDMRNATLAIEALQVTSPTRAFWFTASGFFDTVAANPSEAGALSVQLFGKIDQQIKMLIEGVQKVPEKLFRDLLLVIGNSTADTDRVTRIKALYRLDELLAVPEGVRDGVADDQLKAVVRSLRDRLQSLKDHWLKFSSGNRPALEPFAAEADALAQAALAQPNKDIHQLFQLLSAAGGHLRKVTTPLTESQGLEVATTLLFAESSLENYFRLSPEFATQVASVTTRVKGAMVGAELPALDPNANALMDDMTKRAQERMLMFQVGQEVQVNLATIEAGLDNYFRDQTKTSELNPLLPLFSQVQGALAILDLDEAAALNQILRDRVSQFSSGAMKGAGEDAEGVAEGISALGLYVTALQQNTAQPRDVLMPALVRFGLAAKPVDVEKSAIKSPVSEGDVDVAKQKVQALYEDWKHQPEQTATRDQLRDAVEELKLDAEVVADSQSVKRSEDLLKAIDSSFDPMKADMSAAMSRIAPDKPNEAPTQQSVQLIDASVTQIDEELLEIFLEEAGEVVTTIRSNLDMVRASPHDKEAMVTIRRGYHTLKGSGRMVGLNDLGEVAWNCEQVFNKWLKEEKPASASLLHFTDKTSLAFKGWVDELQAVGTSNIDGAEIARMADALKNDRELDLLNTEVSASPAMGVVTVEAPFAFDTVPDVTVPIPVVEPVVASIDPLPVLDEVPPLPELELPPLVPELPVSVPAAPPVVLPTAEKVFGELPSLDLSLGLAATAAAGAGLMATSASAASANAPVVPPAEPADIAVGTVRVPATLFEIYLEEAGTHVTTLDEEMQKLEANTMQPVSHEFMRAAHTLTSSSRTTGFEMVAEVAHALEKWLQDALEVPPQWNQHRLSVTRQAVDSLGTMIGQIFDRTLPIAQPVCVAELKALRETYADAKRMGEGTNLTVPLVIVQTQKMFAIEEEASEADAALFALAEGQAEPAAFIEEPPLVANDASMSDWVEQVPPPIPAHLIADEPQPDEALEPEMALFSELPPPIPLDMLESAAFFDEEPAAFELPAPPEPEPLIVETALIIETAPIAEEPITAALVSSLPPAPPESAPPAITVVDEKQPIDLSWAAITATGVAASGVAAFVATPTPTPTPAPVEAEPAPKLFDTATPAPAPLVVTPLASAAPILGDTYGGGNERRSVQDDIDPDLLPIFLEEAREIVPQAGTAIRNWRGTPLNHVPVAELARHLHTLKGSARMAGLMRLGELAHVLETQVMAMDAVAEPSAAKFDEIEEGLDRLSGAMERFAAGDVATPIEVPVVTDVSSDLPAPMAKLAAVRAEIVAEGEKLEGRERQAMLRVNADMIDRFVNEAGELAIARSRIELEMLSFKRALLELSENASRMKVQLREIEIQAETQIQSRTKEAQEHGTEFDPLEFDRFSRMQEVTRFLAESLNDVMTLQQSLAGNMDETESALLQQARLGRELQQGLMGVRLVPLGTLQDRFYRLVRQTAKEIDKKANLEFRGVRVEIDRSVLEKITAPFEHLLRNAVAHGLEMPADRVANGKSEIGEISIDAQQAGNEVIMTLTDDGGGLNFVRIREKAIQQGLLEASAEVTDAQLTQFIFMPGFSTADAVTQISGRGVGMDVVRNEIVSLGGRIDISSTPGRGTTFTVALPLTLAVTQAVMVVVNGTTYAIPSVMIEQVQEYKGKRYEPLLEMSEIEWKGNKYPLRSMEALLGGKPTISAQRHASVILAKSGQQRAAVQVDEIIGNREVVVKPIGPQLARIVGMAGATVMGSGQVILIMNPVQLVFREAATVSIEKALATDVKLIASAGAANATASGHGTERDSANEAVEAERGPSLAETIAANMFDDDGIATTEDVAVPRATPLVMVVDDSLTVRKITSRMLTREGFEVMTAKDGVDGLQQLQDVLPDIILLDIEMPRMDGFEFARNVRADAKMMGIPIIMITSRTADKHRNRAMELGVNEYMGKPYQEEQLLVLIRNLTKTRKNVN
jgi:chemosensory pili system protein ChpA (sensor histidine kinase/response regulator)